MTGGGGFLGLAIVRLLVGRGYDVVTFSRGRYAVLDELGVVHVRGDLGAFKDVRDGMRGCEVVFHVAAKAGVWGSFESYYRPNVLGTENVIRACRELGIRHLVFTSFTECCVCRG